MRKSIYSSDYRLLIVLMRRAREERGFTQELVAMHLGITASQLSKWERFERRVDASELRNYCNAIGVPIGQLVRDWEQALAND